MTYDPEDLRQFATAIDWRAAAKAKEEYWCAWKKKHGAEGALRIAEALRQLALAQRPDYPNARERAEDHAAHLRQIEAFERYDRWCRETSR